MKNQTIEEKIKLIEQAIYDGVAVLISNYHSVKSKTNKDRRVYPVKIKGDNVLCADMDLGGEWRQFKFDRMQGNIYMI